MLGISFTSWYLSDIIGDPLAAHINPFQLDVMTNDELDAMSEELGLNRPWYIRFIDHTIKLIQGDWGISPKVFRGSAILDLLIVRLPATIELAIISMIIAISVGIPLGVLSAIKKNMKTDVFARLTSLVGVAIPVFVLGMLIQAVIHDGSMWISEFFFQDHRLLGLIPYEGRYHQDYFEYPSKILFGLFPSTGLLTLDSLLSFNIVLFFDSLLHIIIPACVLAYSQVAIISRMTRASMLETLKEDYILLARAKGLSERTVIYKHALRNAIFPTFTIGSIILATLLTGSVLIETVFRWPGLGTFATDGINSIDMAIIQGFVMISAIIFVITNLIVDLVYGYLDPRIRLLE